MKQILTIFVFLFSLGVLASGAFIVYQKTELIRSPSVGSKIADNVQMSEIEHNDMWLKSFPPSSNESFQYPATELFVKFDFAKNPQENAMRSIEIKDLDEYKAKVSQRLAILQNPIHSQLKCYIIIQSLM